MATKRSLCFVTKQRIKATREGNSSKHNFDKEKGLKRNHINVRTSSLDNKENTNSRNKKKEVNRTAPEDSFKKKPKSRLKLKRPSTAKLKPKSKIKPNLTVKTSITGKSISVRPQTAKPSKFKVSKKPYTSTLSSSFTIGSLKKGLRSKILK